MNVAFIPVRGGSKSIPQKNIKPLAGRPLVYWAMKAACECRYIDKVYIATDSEQIKYIIDGLKQGRDGAILEKAEVIGRSDETATDTASTESAMLEFASKYIFETIVLIQATSPLLTADDLDGGFELYMQDETDSVLSVVRQKRFCWSVGENGYALPQNYDVYNRPRRQEFSGYFVENGAFYITRRKNLLKSRNRISGKIRSYEMNEESYYEIDEPEDWIIIEQQLERRERARHLKKEKPVIKMFLTDCDGCLTDGGMYYSESGDELKKFNTLDGVGFRLLQEQGILTGIITGEDRELVKQRVQKLKLDILEMGVKDKAAKIREICQQKGIKLQNVVYVGDDVVDIEAIKMVGFGCAVKNGMDMVKAVADYVTVREGGSGAVREVVDYILTK